MHVTYAPDSANDWLAFYQASISENPQYQLGGGGVIRGFRAYAPYHRGVGLGSFFKGLYRLALPLFKTIGKHALVSGSKIAADVASGRNLKQSAVEHGKTAAAQALRETTDRIQAGKGVGRRLRVQRTRMLKKRKPSRKASVKRRKLPKAVGLDVFGD